jgi:hypothetical protein
VIRVVCGLLCCPQITQKTWISGVEKQLKARNAGGKREFLRRDQISLFH